LDNTFEIRDEEIDVEEIMRKIRENIRMRREAGIYPEGEIEEIHPASGHQDQSSDDKPISLSAEARRDLDYINSSWDVENKGYFISSHRPVAGKFLVTGRELVHGEVRRYVDPAIWKQREFNGSVVRLLNEVARGLDEIGGRLAKLECALREARSETAQMRSDLGSDLARLDASVDERIDSKVQDVRSDLGSDLARLDASVDERIGSKVQDVRSDLGSDLARLDASVDERIDSKVQDVRSDLGSDLARLDASVDERIDSKVQDVRSDLGSDLARLDASVDERIGSKVQDVRSDLGSDLARLDASVDERIGSKVQDVRSEIGRELYGLDSKIEERVRREANAVISAMDLEIKSMASLASILEGRLKDFEDVPLSSDAADYDGMNYFVFEEAFRGSRETIKERQAAFVRYFEGSKNVLDIGCGRGEFLELLRDSGIGGRGIDSNEDMVAFCRSRGLDVERIDAITYLDGLEDKSLDGVFLDQVVEHLRPDYMVKLLGLCYKKLKYGHHIVVETVNPLSFYSLANFYIDLTHVRPVHPETLRFLLGAVGFREVENRFISPILDDARLKKMEAEEGMNDLTKQLIETCNRNIEMLNVNLYGAQDFAMIGKK